MVDAGHLVEHVNYKSEPCLNLPQRKPCKHLRFMCYTHCMRAVLSRGCLCRLLMGLSPSLRARLFEWISSFTKADSGDDHVSLYPKGSQPPSSQ